MYGMGKIEREREREKERERVRETVVVDKNSRLAKCIMHG